MEGSGLWPAIIENDGQPGRVVAQRRQIVVQQLLGGTAGAADRAGLLRRAGEALETHADDLPLVLFYLDDPSTGSQRLTHASGLPPGRQASPKPWSGG